MKNRWLIFNVIFLILFFVIVVSYYNPDALQTFPQHDVTYALTVDGVRTSTIPSKGMYNVDVVCENAVGEWLYDEWKLKITDMKTEKVNCNLTFKTINQAYLNEYIINLSGKAQGSGRVVNEILEAPNYASATTLTQSQYGTISMYSSSSSSSTSGATTTGTFAYSGDEWSSVPSTMTSGTYYHFKFTPEESGYYQLCYNISAGNSSNQLYVYVNSIQLTFNNLSYVYASTSSTRSGCRNLGYISTNDIIRIVQRAYSNTSYGISTIGFSIEEASTINEVYAGYRYEGKDPNNYIWFNNELWRIIGVFDEESHGISSQRLVKIIRNESIGAYAFDKDERSNWTTSSLMNLLNRVYLYRENGTGGDFCYGYDTIPSNCNYTVSGINDTYRPMIKNVTWYLGSPSDNYATADEFYEDERGTNVWGESPTSTIGYIGLMYPSDYGYSVLESSCPRMTNLSSYGTAACTGQSWLYKYGGEWTITPYKSGAAFTLMNNIIYVGPTSPGDDCNNGYYVRPTLYLDSSVYVFDGDGSISDPYIIGM